MTTETTAEQEPAAGSAGAVTDEQLISMLVDRARGDGLQQVADELNNRPRLCLGDKSPIEAMQQWSTTTRSWSFATTARNRPVYPVVFIARTAHSRSSSGYFVGAGMMTPTFAGNRASKKSVR